MIRVNIRQIIVPRPQPIQHGGFFRCVLRGPRIQIAGDLDKAGYRLRGMLMYCHDAIPSASFTSSAQVAELTNGPAAWSLQYRGRIRSIGWAASSRPVASKALALRCCSAMNATMWCPLQPHAPAVAVEASSVMTASAKLTTRRHVPQLQGFHWLPASKPRGGCDNVAPRFYGSGHQTHRTLPWTVPNSCRRVTTGVIGPSEDIENETGPLSKTLGKPRPFAKRRSAHVLIVPARTH